MRLFVAVAVATSLFATTLLAAETVAPLAPAKPAGIKKAQGTEMDDSAWWVIGGLAATGIIIGVSSGGSSSTPATS